jgi:flavodoxin
MNKALVAYFSATGVTARLAATLCKAAQADLFEIKPAQPYTAADLDWRDAQSRSSLEMKDASARPAIAARVEDMARYDVVFVGFPIWWYQAPRIVETFLEAYDFSGKTVVPFATSGGSGMGRTGEILAALTGETVNWVEGERFSPSATAKEMAAWLTQKGLLPYANE